ncbi:MAG: hypothetical protein JSV27_08615 [Candidatus Bathyarchaeota archaeon]|nr:MAG: hypothetical protein JSV27_08615 [Candidatus Bathyarchaeota archaeon]
MGMNVLPLLTAIVAFVFTAMLVRQYLERRKIHQILWSVAMLFYGTSALMEFLMNPDILGPSIIAFRIYYVLAAPLVGLLGAGVMYLLASKRKADMFMVGISLLSVVLIVTGMIEPLERTVIIEAFEGPLGEAFRAAVHAYPMSVRRYAIVINIVGGFALILGALWSFLKDRRRTYNLLIFVGGILPMIGGSALAFFGEPSLFFIFELGGTVFLFLGFVYSDRFIKAREARATEALKKRSIE